MIFCISVRYCSRYFKLKCCSVYPTPFNKLESTALNDYLRCSMPKIHNHSGSSGIKFFPICIIEMDPGPIIYIQRKRQIKIPSLYFDGPNILTYSIERKKEIEHFFKEICIGIKDTSPLSIKPNQSQFTNLHRYYIEPDSDAKHSRS